MYFGTRVVFVTRYATLQHLPERTCSRCRLSSKTESFVDIQRIVTMLSKKSAVAMLCHCTMHALQAPTCPICH